MFVFLIAIIHSFPHPLLQSSPRLSFEIVNLIVSPPVREEELLYAYFGVGLFYAYVRPGHQKILYE